MLLDEPLELKFATPNLSFPADRSSPEVFCTDVEKCFDVDMRGRVAGGLAGPLFCFLDELALELEFAVCVLLLELAIKRD